MLGFSKLSGLLLLLSLFSYKEKPTTVVETEVFEGWEVSIKESRTDTANLRDWLLDAEKTIVFKYKSDSICSTPNLAFYPIELKEFVNKKLKTYLLLRAFYYPLPLVSFKTKQHFVIGWNFESKDYKCCECEELKSLVIKEYDLQVIDDPVKHGFQRFTIDSMELKE